MLQRRISGVVGAEAGKGFVLGEDDGAGVAAALDHARAGRREWTRGPSRRPRSARCPETDALAPRPLPVRSAQLSRSRMRGIAAHRVRLRIQRVSPRATADVGNSTACGIQWDFMGFHGQYMGNARISAAFQACLTARSCLVLARSTPVDKSVDSESRSTHDCASSQLGKHASRLWRRRRRDAATSSRSASATTVASPLPIAAMRDRAGRALIAQSAGQRARRDGQRPR